MKKEKIYSHRTEKDYGFWRTFFNIIFYLLFVRTAAKYMYNLKVEGKENIPKTSHLIVAPNHVSYCDPEFVTYAIGKLVAYMAKRELFHMDLPMPIKSIKGRKLLRFLAWHLGAFEVDRDKPKPSTFKTVRRIFNTKWCFGIFPEGGVRQDKKIRDIKRGVAYFAKKYKADVLPVAVCGFTWYATRLFQRNMTIKIGKPISYTLEENEIIQEWARQISEMTGFENLVEKQFSQQRKTVELK
jgi:1-acyl-sn-glycerol-3-phosphate acyltransferase